MQVTLPLADVLCVYGLPDPELYAELKLWLEEKEERYLILLEDDERALVGHKASHDRIRLCFGDSEEALKQLAWEFVFLHFDYLPIPGNSLKDRTKMEKLFAKMAFLVEGVHLVASDFKERGIDRLQNCIANAEIFPKAHLGQELFGKFSQIPAVICGAGPSLEKEREFLQGCENRALIFAGGTALASLSQMGISPHFGALIDPHPPSERYFSHEAYKVPTFFQSRAHPTLLKQVQGELLWIPGSKNDFFETKTFEGGWNVATFLTALAYHLGCDPIVFVGVDLAQEKEKAYAGDLSRPEGGKLIPLEEEGLFTRSDWLFAADWLRGFAKEHPQVHWGKRPMQRFEKEVDLRNMVAAAIQKSKKKENFAVEKLKNSIARVLDLISQILELLEKIFPKPPEKNGEYALLQLEIEKEMAYAQFLVPVWDVWKYVFQRQVPKDVPFSYGMELNQWLFMKGICEDARKI